MLIRPTDTLLRLGRPPREGRDVYDWLARHGAEPTAGIVNMMLMSGGLSPPVTTIYNHTGADQSYTVPWGIERLHVRLWGAGGGGPTGGSGRGGKGGYITGILAVTPGQDLTIMVGAGGASHMVDPPIGSSYGGGAGGRGSQGGGRTAIRVSGADIVTAGGGGGSGPSYSGGDGGHGGYPAGTAGTVGGYYTTGGQGGTQSAGGLGGTGEPAGHGSNPGQPGTQYAGGINNPDDGGNGGGGGGGWWGGGGGAYYGGGGGGSSYPGGLTSWAADTGLGATATSDPYYVTGLAIGGAANTPGGSGRVVITTIP